MNEQARGKRSETRASKTQRFAARERKRINILIKYAEYAKLDLNSELREIQEREDRVANCVCKTCKRRDSIRSYLYTIDLRLRRYASELISLQAKARARQ